VLHVKELVEVLSDEAVDFVLIGGLAAVLHGSAYVTYDMDIAYSRERENCQRLAKALSQLNPSLRGAPLGLPFLLDANTLRNGANFTLSTNFGDLDLLGEVTGLGSYREVRAVSVEMEAFGRKVFVLGLEGLIRAKRAAGRGKDLLLVPELEALLALKPKL
jgi:hypothetical protein